MKRLGIVIALLAAVLAIDQLVRFLDREPQSEPLHSADGENGGRAEKAGTDPPLQPAIDPARSPEAVPAAEAPQAEELLPEVSRPDSIAHGPECIAFMEETIRMEGNNLAGEPVKRIQAVKERGVREAVFSFLLDYLSCKAVETRDYSYCSRIEAYFPPLSNVFSCRDAFRIFLPLGAYHVEHMDAERFQSSVEDLPDPMRKWMTEFFTVIAEKKPERCKRLGDSPLTSGICKIAGGAIKKPPEQNELRHAYYIIMALRSKNETFLEVVEGEAPEAMVRSYFGERGLCEAYLKREMKRFCLE